MFRLCLPLLFPVTTFTLHMLTHPWYINFLSVLLVYTGSFVKCIIPTRFLESFHFIYWQKCSWQYRFELIRRTQCKNMQYWSLFEVCMLMSKSSQSKVINKEEKALITTAFLAKHIFSADVEKTNTSCRFGRHCEMTKINDVVFVSCLPLAGLLLREMPQFYFNLENMQCC